jgi:hypothetical protein
VGTPVAVLTDFDREVHCDWIVLRTSVNPAARPANGLRWVPIADLAQVH